MTGENGPWRAMLCYVVWRVAFLRNNERSTFEEGTGRVRYYTLAIEDITKNRMRKTLVNENDVCS